MNLSSLIGNTLYIRADGPYKINMLVPKELGEWDCPECGNLNWAKREKCNGRNESCKVIQLCPILLGIFIPQDYFFVGYMNFWRINRSINYYKN